MAQEERQIAGSIPDHSSSETRRRWRRIQTRRRRRTHILAGARITILIECKRSSRPVERDDLQVLWSKLQDVKAHKAMLFSTSGFQRGAITYARKYKIATVIFIDGQLTYQTRGAFAPARAPAWVNLPKYAGYLVEDVNERVRASLIDEGHVDALSRWLEG